MHLTTVAITGPRPAQLRYFRGGLADLLVQRNVVFTSEGGGESEGSEDHSGHSGGDMFQHQDFKIDAVFGFNLGT